MTEPQKAKVDFICQHAECKKTYKLYESKATREKEEFCSAECEATTIRKFDVTIGFTTSAFTTVSITVVGLKDPEKEIQELLNLGVFGQLRAFMTKTGPSNIKWEYTRPMSHIAHISPT
jgi:hypothetical protein